MIILLLASLFALSAHAEELSQNVILITLDGVRYREVFDGVRMQRRAREPRWTPVIPDVQRIIERDGFFFGDARGGDSSMWISNRASLSQPGYRAILSGQFEKKCRKNNCGVIDHETIFDRLLDENFAPKSVAAFSSWEVLDRCLESKTPRAVRSTSFSPIQGLSPEESAPFNAILTSAKADRPAWTGSRYDRYTFDMGLLYLKTYRPRFLYMMFVDTDEYAHDNDYRRYIRSLRDFNQRFVTLVETLKEMGEYGRETSIVVTTDHGRGRGPLLWQKHSKEWFDSRHVWAMALPSEGLRERYRWRRSARDDYFQVDVRPTIERFLGLEPREPKKGRGLALVETY